jgi:hypothetical protein
LTVPGRWRSGILHLLGGVDTMCTRLIVQELLGHRQREHDDDSHPRSRPGAPRCPKPPRSPRLRRSGLSLAAHQHASGESIPCR